MSELWYFLRQIFLPAQKMRDDEEIVAEKETDTEPTRLAILLEICRERFLASETIGLTVSLFLHLLLVLLLSFFFLQPTAQWGGFDWIGSGFNDIMNDGAGAGQEMSVTPPPIPGSSGGEKPVETKFNETPILMDDSSGGDAGDPGAVQDPGGSTPVEETSAGVGTGLSQNSKPARSGGFVPGGGFGGRSSGGGGGGGGGNGPGFGTGSGPGDVAVESALAYLAKHQNPDGSWSFHFEHSCKRCSHSGTHGSRIAATSIALLPFLGAGNTDQQGPYQNVVKKGLLYLLDKGTRTTRGRAYDQGEDGMYSHGLATMVLCEAVAMTGRPKSSPLGSVAQDAVTYIENAQDPATGGWRYKPGQSPGDLSVTAWQVLALKSAKLGGLDVSQATIYRIEDFLDRANIRNEYVYLPSIDPTRPPERQGLGEYSKYTCDATGCVLRMYLGWQPGLKHLDETMRIVASRGPQKVLQEKRAFSLYYAYYSTLAMHHYGGSESFRWFTEMRDFLVKTQMPEKAGCEAGSWYFPDFYTDKGGRLLNTALGAMVLETPYRIMPLYQRDE